MGDPILTLLLIACVLLIANLWLRLGYNPNWPIIALFLAMGLGALCCMMPFVMLFVMFFCAEAESRKLDAWVKQQNRPNQLGQVRIPVTEDVK